MAAAAYDAFDRPGLLILVFVVTVISAGFHEFGHAAAARYGGATPGVMGFGLYLLWPAFYTDVTDSYRLGRGGRLRTDLGGLYFNAIVAVAITGLWLVLRYDALLLVVATQIIQMIRQLTPLVRFDGYHVLADLTGVPDLYGRIKPTLVGMLPWRWRDPQASQLKWWARIVVTAWVIVVIPLLIGMITMAVLALPRLLGSAWAGLNKQQDVLATAWADGDMVQATARVLAMIAIVIPMAGLLYLLFRMARKIVSTVWQGTAGKPLTAHARRRDRRRRRGGHRVCVVPARRQLPADRSVGARHARRHHLRVAGRDHGRLRSSAAKQRSRSPPQHPFRRPTGRDVGVVGHPHPATDGQLATARGDPGSPAAGIWRWPTVADTSLRPPTSHVQRDEGWVFPFDKPIAPTPGDGNNQAMAVNTTDNTVVYDAAFALVWATDAKHAMNINEAHAYASCNNCAAVAVAYQVVFVVDTDDTNDNVAVPQNLAGALNYDCVNCITYALARQLFVTLDEELSPTAKEELDALWSEIAAYGEQIADRRGRRSNLIDEQARGIHRTRSC